MGDLSPHFSRSEFADRRDGSLEGPDPHLLEHLEELRALCGGRPLRIVSGYRSAATNLEVGGARNSLHLVGQAADIPSGYATVAQAEESGFTGIGEKAGWAIHVDVRRGTAARWQY